MIGVWSKTTEEILLSFEGLLFHLCSVGLLVLEIGDQLRIVVGGVPEKEQLLVGDLVDLILEVICNLVVSHIIAEVLLSLMIV